MAGIVVALAATALPAAHAAAADSTVKHTGSFSTLIRNDPPPPNGGTPRCTFVNIFQWSELPGAVSYTVSLEDTVTGSYTTTFPPYTADGEIEGFPPVAKGLHRQGLNGGSGPGPCTSDSLARWTLTSMTANFCGPAPVRSAPGGTTSLQAAAHSPFQDGEKCDSRVVGTVTEPDGVPIEGVPISISGAGSKKTNAYGVYGSKVKPGRHTVSAPKGFCVKGPSKCTQSKSVNVKGPEPVDFVRSDEMVTLSGTVLKRDCIDLEYATQLCEYLDRLPAADRAVIVSGAGATETVTDSDGKYSFEVPAGKHTVRVPGTPKTVKPASLNVDGTKDVPGLDFEVCTAPEGYTGDPLRSCELVEIDGKVVDIDRRSFSNARVAGPGDFTYANESGNFSLLVPRGRVRLVVATNAIDGAVGRVSLNATKKVNTVQVVLEPAFINLQASTTEVLAAADALPLNEDGFDIGIEREEPVVDRICRFRQFGEVSINEGGHGRSGGVSMTPNKGYSTFCTGSYKATLFDPLGRPLASRKFVINEASSP